MEYGGDLEYSGGSLVRLLQDGSISLLRSDGVNVDANSGTESSRLLIVSECFDQLNGVTDLFATFECSGEGCILEECCLTRLSAMDSSWEISRLLSSWPCWYVGSRKTPVISVCDLIEYVTGVHVVPKARCGR